MGIQGISGTNEVAALDSSQESGGVDKSELIGMMLQLMMKFLEEMNGAGEDGAAAPGGDDSAGATGGPGKAKGAEGKDGGDPMSDMLEVMGKIIEFMMKMLLSGKSGGSPA